MKTDKAVRLPGHFVGSIVLGDLLSDEEHSLISLHLLVDGGVQGIPDRQLLGSHDPRRGKGSACQLPHGGRQRFGQHI